MMNNRLTSNHYHHSKSLLESLLNHYYLITINDSNVWNCYSMAILMCLLFIVVPSGKLAQLLKIAHSWLIYL